MRPLLFAGASLLALLAASPPNASAATTVFSYTGTPDKFPVLTTGEYLITAYGAQGGERGGSR